MKQITEDYCNKEISVLLWEKGFDELCIKKYNKDGFLQNAGNKIEEWQNSELDEDEYSAPTHQMALKWLREVHKLHIFAKPYWPQGDMRNKMSWQGFIVDLNTINRDSQCYADSFEEAIENRIKFALENLI